jgi:hypothetical protein
MIRSVRVIKRLRPWLMMKVQVCGNRGRSVVTGGRMCVKVVVVLRGSSEIVVSSNRREREGEKRERERVNERYTLG